MTKVTVIRSKWYRGNGAETSALLCGVDGRMCCLGFAAIAGGLTPADIGAKQTPAEVPAWPFKGMVSIPEEGVDEFGEEYRPANTERCERLMDINDSITLTDEEREAQLAEVGINVGIQFAFID